jgi:pimeloyl-ACP methyl ester carboxylesterase
MSTFPSVVRSRSVIVPVLVHALAVIALTAVLAPPLHTSHAQEVSPEATPVLRFRDTVEVDSRDLGLSCFGSGSPTVVLVGGYRRPSEDVWPPTVDEVSSMTRVCVFDRAGMGMSDPAPTGSQTHADVAADLHAALEASGEPGPYVLVGFSIGGPFVRLYASTHPQEVAGLVLVDPVPMGYPQPTGWGPTLHEILEREAPDEAEAERLVDEGRDPEHTAPINSFVGEEELLAAPAPPAVPAVLIVRGPLDPDPIPQLEAVWQEANRALAQDLGARVIVAEQSGHFVPTDEPEVVIAAIEAVVEAVRDPSSWATPAAGTPSP